MAIPANTQQLQALEQMKPQLHLITGGAGCIGSELATALIAAGHRVRVIDNLSSGRKEHVAHLIGNPRFEFHQGDVLMSGPLRCAFLGVGSPAPPDTVWHMCCKTDIKFTGGAEAYDFDEDYSQNLDATWYVLQEMRTLNVKRIAFCSSAAVYGNQSIIDEDFLPEPVSMYGATKLASEALIRVMALRCGMQAWVFRFSSIVSPRFRTSGNMVIPDLINKLRKDPTRLEILGDGRQTKPSLLVSDCVEAMQFIVANAQEPFNLYNLGAPDTISVTRQAELICEAMGLVIEDPPMAYWSPEFIYKVGGEGGGGWPGDVPSFRMRVDKLANLGWRTRHTSEEACRVAIAGLLESFK